MSKEVERYTFVCDIENEEYVLASDYDALLAERDDLKKDAERYRAFRKAGLPNGLGAYDAELDAACDELIEDQREDA